MVIEVRSGSWTRSCHNASNLDCENLDGRLLLFTEYTIFIVLKLKDVFSSILD